MSPRQRRYPGRNAGSLRGQLVTNALVSIALPLSLAGAVVFFFLSYHLQIIESSFARSQEALTRDIAGTDIRAQASNAARQLDEFLIERITEAKAWATARVVVDAARGAHERHRAAGLVGTPVEEIEARFHRRKSLGIAPAANTYLRQQIAASPFFVLLLFRRIRLPQPLGRHRGEGEGPSLCPSRRRHVRRPVAAVRDQDFRPKARTRRPAVAPGQGPVRAGSAFRASMRSGARFFTDCRPAT